MTTATQSLSHDTLRVPGLAVLTGPVATALISLPFLVFGAGHFFGADGMAAFVPSWVPGGGLFWVYVTGIAMIAGGVGVWTKKLAVPAALGLALLMVTFALTVHLPLLGDEAMGKLATMGLLKDLALAGGLLAFAKR
jgi:putative oxidoreductase